jgi:hypothetical protein
MTAQKIHKLRQKHSGTLQLKSKTTANLKVTINRFAKAVHSVPPGHGIAMVRRDARSTFA